MDCELNDLGIITNFRFSDICEDNTFNSGDVVCGNHNAISCTKCVCDAGGNQIFGGQAQHWCNGFCYYEDNKCKGDGNHGVIMGLNATVLRVTLEKMPSEYLQNCPRNVERSSSSEDSFGGTRMAIFSRVTRRTVAFKHYYIG